MLAKRIIACLDLANGRVVKGVKFQNLRDAGDPVELAKRYSDEGADEVVLLDVTASHEARETMVNIVRAAASQIFVPVTVGGGVRSVADARALLFAGADKVSVNSAAVRRPELISELAQEFGSQAVVLAIDARRRDRDWAVVVHGGRIEAEFDAVSWAQRGEALGAGEILLTSMDTDGTLAGFDLALTEAVCAVTQIPVVASGGAGKAEDFVQLFQSTAAQAGLAASIFHDEATSIHAVKELLRASGVRVRPA